MNGNYTFALAMGTGFVAGLRSMTAPAAVSWGAHLGRLSLRDSVLESMGSAAAVAIFSVLAAAEFVVDLLPQAPNRTEPASLLVRILAGWLTGACVCVSAGHSTVAGGVLGAIGGVIGAFAGFLARTRLVSGLKVPGAVIAIPEDLVAIGLGYLLVFWG